MSDCHVFCCQGVRVCACIHREKEREERDLWRERFQHETLAYPSECAPLPGVALSCFLMQLLQLLSVTRWQFDRCVGDFFQLLLKYRGVCILPILESLVELLLQL